MDIKFTDNVSKKKLRKHLDGFDYSLKKKNSKIGLGFFVSKYLFTIV